MVGALCTKNKLSKSSLVNSHDNKVRSLKVYYEGGVMSQRKDKAISLSTTSSSGIIQVPRLTPLNQLMSFIKGSISECVPCYPLGNGFHRKLRDILPHMVKIYSQEHYKSEIVSFSPNEYVASVGLDGAPSAKMGSMTCGLISFSNCLTLANSCLHNYLLFGLSAKETDSIVVEYLIQLHKEMVAVEKETFDIDGKTVSFKFKIFPNDLKMVAQLAGELNNAARYPTTFAKVRKEDTTLPCAEPVVWQTWSMPERMKLSEQVSKFCEKHSNRKKQLDFIAGLGCRQNSNPLFGNYTEFFRLEPLHLKNNSYQLLHSRILEFVEAVSGYNKSKKLDSVAEDSPLKTYLNGIREEIKAGKLYKRIMSAYTDGGSAGDIRFTGEDSHKFAEKLLLVLRGVLHSSSTSIQLPVNQFTVVLFAYMAVQLRLVMSIAQRIHIDNTHIDEVRIAAKQYHNSFALFNKATCSTWLVCNVLPEHIADMYRRFGYGLGLNSMQGREAKHKSINDYARFSSPQTKWQDVFRHEYVHCIWLKLNDAHIKPGREAKELLPSSIPNHCCKRCRLPSDIDVFCTSQFWGKIDDSCKKGRVHNGLAKLWH